VEEIEGKKMGEKSLKIQKSDLAESIRGEVRDEFPHISDKQVEAIAEVRLQALMSSPVNVKQKLKVVTMSEDKDLSLNYKKQILK
jgi:ligand-binding sensor domain-containing protein